jgi:protein XagA
MNLCNKIKSLFMNIKFQYLIALFCSILLTPSVSQAQAWTKSKGMGFYKLDFSSIQATDVFDTKGIITPSRSIGTSVTSFYGEHGLTDKITAIAYIPFLVNNTLGAQTGTVALPSVKNNKFGDVDLAFRFALPVKKIAMSATILLGLPTGDAKQVNALYSGDGEFNQMLKIAAGMGGKRWWGQSAVGFNNRTKGFSDEFRYDLELGYKFFEGRFLTILKINGVESFNNGTVKAAPTGLYSNNVEYGGIGPEFLYYANAKKTVGVSLHIAGAFKGQNILAAPSLSGGVFMEF